MITAHVPRKDPEGEPATIAITEEQYAQEDITIDIPDLFPPRKPMNPDPTTEEWDEQIRELTHKLAETAEDRDRLRAKVIDLTSANENMAREIAAYEDRVQRLVAQVEGLENCLDENADRIVHLKAQLYDYAVIGGLLTEGDD